MIAKNSARLLSLVLLLGTAADALAARRAKNVILFLGDAGGIPTLNAAGILAHSQPQSLYLQHMPYIALSDTSSLDAWVTDSAAGMTAIVTGRKTNNKMLSVLPGVDGAPPRPLKTILEYAEERGLATGVITNMPAWDATPAACYAHIDARTKAEEIYTQFFHPRFGDGVDILIGKDRKRVDAIYAARGLKASEVFEQAGYRVFNSPDDYTADARRAVAIYDGEDFAPIPVVDRVIKNLSAHRQGYFLMVEWDMHTDHLERGLSRVIVMDDLIRHVAAQVGDDTLILFAADHSFGLRLRGGQKSTPFAEQVTAVPLLGRLPLKSSPITVEATHTGEEILVAAQGPGAERVHGFLPNTGLFKIMLAAYRWKEDAP